MRIKNIIKYLLLMTGTALVVIGIIGIFYCIIFCITNLNIIFTVSVEEPHFLRLKIFVLSILSFIIGTIFINQSE